MISAIILAAGLSSRMEGRNKLLLKFRDKAILQHTIEEILASEAMEASVVVGHQKEEIKRLVEENKYPVEILENPNYKTGMTSSIKKGVAGTSQHADGYMICMADMPLVRSQHYNSIILAFRKSIIRDSKTICVPYYDGRRGNPVIFSSEYKEDLLYHDKPEGCREIVDASGSHVVKVDLSTKINILDIDKNEDYLTLA